MALDLVPLWTVIVGFSVFMYVLLDGFDLGVGILLPFAPGERARDLIMRSVGPVWDGNETWLVFGALGLFTAFPLAFAIIMPAVYFPVLMMVLGLIFRGVAFEFRPAAPEHRRFWNSAFSAGSLLATFAQGCVLGKFIEGFAVSGRNSAGSMWDWLDPFAIAVGLGLIFGYALLGATWLVLKTGGALQAWARLNARRALVGVLALIAMVSLWTPLSDAHIAARWFTWPDIALLSPVPILTAVIARGLWRAAMQNPAARPFFAAIALFALCYLGLAISILPYIVKPAITLWDAASASKSQAFTLVGALFLLPITVMYTAWSYWVFRGKVGGDIEDFD